MKIGNFELTFGRKPENVEKRKSDSQDIYMKVVQRQSTRTTQDITAWRRSVSNAENVITPDRTPLQVLFNEIKFDAHVSMLMTHVIQYLQGTEWCVYDETKEDDAEDEEAEKVLNDKWFQDFITECIKAEFYGYSLINFGNIVDGKFSEIKSIDRRYIIPELDAMKTDLNNRASLIYYNEPHLKNWVLFIGDKNELGLLNKAAPYWIYKKQATSSWAEYQQILGIPPRVGKTNIRDNDRRTNMLNMLRDMGHSSYAVLDTEDLFEFVSPVVPASGENAFDLMIQVMNGELSKLFVGQTMTSEDGSSRSQSEVHNEIFEMIMQGRKQGITDIVNRQLKPILLAHGMWKNPNLRFKFEEKEEELDHKTKVDTLDKLLKYYTMTPEAIKQYIGLEVEEKEVPDQLQGGFTEKAPEDKTKALKNYYQLEDFKHNHDGC